MVLDRGIIIKIDIKEKIVILIIFFLIYVAPNIDMILDLCLGTGQDISKDIQYLATIIVGPKGK